MHRCYQRPRESRELGAQGQVPSGRQAATRVAEVLHTCPDRIVWRSDCSLQSKVGR